MHESSIEEILQHLRKAQRAAVRAVDAGDLETVHEREVEIDEALHALDGHSESLPESRREQAQELLGELFAIVDSLHEAAEAGDVSLLERLVLRLGALIEEIQPWFQQPGAAGVQTSVR